MGRPPGESGHTTTVRLNARRRPHEHGESYRMPHATAVTPSSGHRPRWWTELPLIAVVYGLYSMGRLLVHENIPAAVDNGLAILRLEKALHLNAEHPLNRLLTGHPSLGIPADFAYASLHYLVTPAVLVWIFRRRSAAYRAARTWLMTSTLLGLVGFTLMPTCPPRLLDAQPRFRRHDGAVQRVRLVGRRRERPARAERDDQPVRRDAEPARRLGGVVRCPAVAPRPSPARPDRRCRLSAGHRVRRDGHGEPLFPRRRGRRRRDGRRGPADKAVHTARGPRQGPGEGGVRTGARIPYPDEIHNCQ